MDETDTDRVDKKVDARVTGTLKRIGLVLGILTGGLGILGAYVTIPRRLDEAEKRIETLQHQRETDHEILVKIEERLKIIQWRRNPDE